MKAVLQKFELAHWLFIGAAALVSWGVTWGTTQSQLGGLRDDVQRIDLDGSRALIKDRVDTAAAIADLHSEVIEIKKDTEHIREVLDLKIQVLLKDRR